MFKIIKYIKEFFKRHNKMMIIVGKELNRISRNEKQS